MIGEIETKTKVINDIVFQAKLLSFNASVEAARAGESGKGFAVVAEEVGNLAQMSGTAAKEISELLTNSINKVQSIVRETQTQVNGQVSVGKSKVDTGTGIAKKCHEVFIKVNKSVADVDHMVTEISTASHEQSQGIDEINKAMNQLDQTTQQNATVARQSADSAENLKEKSKDLESMVVDLVAMFQGSKVKQSAPPRSTGNKPKPTTKPKLDLLSSTSKREKNIPKTNPEMIPSHDDPRFEDI